MNSPRARARARPAVKTLHLRRVITLQLSRDIKLRKFRSQGRRTGYRFALLQRTFESDTKTEADIPRQTCRRLPRRNSAIVYLAAHFPFPMTGVSSLREGAFFHMDSIFDIEFSRNLGRRTLLFRRAGRARIKVEHRALTRCAQTSDGSASVGKLAARSRSCSRLDTSSTDSLIHFRLNLPAETLDLHERNLYRPLFFYPRALFLHSAVIANHSDSREGASSISRKNDSSAL